MALGGLWGSGQLGNAADWQNAQNNLLQQQQRAYQQGYVLSYGTTAYSGASSIIIGSYPEATTPARSLTDKRSPNEVWLDRRVDEFRVSL